MVIWLGVGVLYFVCSAITFGVMRARSRRLKCPLAIDFDGSLDRGDYTYDYTVYARHPDEAAVRDQRWVLFSALMWPVVWFITMVEGIWIVGFHGLLVIGGIGEFCYEFILPEDKTDSDESVYIESEDELLSREIEEAHRESLEDELRKSGMPWCTDCDRPEQWCMC